MVDVIEITIEEFKDNIYNRYIKLFPDEEQRDWNKIEKTYKNGIEKFYKIVLGDEIIGFFMLERINGDYPFYLDYIGIYEEYQNKGYGTEAIKVLLDRIVNKQGLIIEIEKEDKENAVTIKRAEFYKRLGFKSIDSEYFLYKVYYTPMYFSNSNHTSKEEYDKIFFEYYTINCGEEEIKNNCKFIK